ncbi:hypothetical protein ACFSCX_06385 [Bacillus salitolerans]|uniref:Uncharacterized protein n=1 Tax=Bacillus salitolerans TaxID=1437434 RepID=A0ABW4LLX9_9BACI
MRKHFTIILKYAMYSYIFITFIVLLDGIGLLDPYKEVLKPILALPNFATMVALVYLIIDLLKRENDKQKELELEIENKKKVKYIYAPTKAYVASRELDAYVRRSNFYAMNGEMLTKEFSHEDGKVSPYLPPYSTEVEHSLDLLIGKEYQYYENIPTLTHEIRIKGYDGTWYCAEADTKALAICIAYLLASGTLQ